MMPDESWLYGSLAALFGLLIGSFLNVVIYRLPKMMEAGWAQEHAEYAAQQEGRSPEELSAPERFNLMVPASRCQSCGHVIRWYENIPVLSWIVLRGKCSSCHALISVRYPLVEIATAVLAWLCFARYGLQISTLVWFAFAAALLCLTLIDWDTTYLPDDITLPLLWGGLLASAMGWTGISLQAAVWGAALGYVSLWLVYWGFKLATGKEGMGFGDFKLFAALGAWLGAQALIPIILLASVVGAVIGIALKINSRLREGGYVPFGPFLALGGYAVWLWGAPRILLLIGLAP